MSGLEVLVVGVMAVGLLALGTLLAALVVAGLLVRRLAGHLTDQLVLPIRAAWGTDGDARRLAAVRREIRRSAAATERARVSAQRAGVPAETVRLAGRVSAALRATDRELAAAQRDPDVRVRRQLAAAGGGDAERLLAASTRLRTVLAGTARAAVGADVAGLERDVAVEEQVSAEWVSVHGRLAAGSTGA